MPRAPTKRPRARSRYNPTSCLPKGVLETISPPTLEGSERDVVPENLVYIGSYNWVDSQTPTIVVPGSPRIWADRKMPMRVPIDSGKNFIDQNGHRMKDFTLVPLFKAVQDLSDQGITQKFDWPSVDFVADRGRLRKLLAWAKGASDQWRIDTQLAGVNTVLLSGRAPVTKERSGRSTSYGFRFEVMSTYPAPGLENAPGHHRIIAYVCVLLSELINVQRYQDFDGIRMVVRFEVDACLPHATTTSSTSPSNNRSTGRKVTKKKSSLGSSSNPSDVNIIRAGSSQVPQTHLLELKTRKRQKLGWQQSYPQLYLSQTPHIHYAFHENGTFTSLRKFTLGQSQLANTDRTAQVGFKKLRKLLGYIKSLVLKYGAMRITLVCVNKTLSVYRTPKGNCLPEDLLALFVA